MRILFKHTLFIITAIAIVYSSQIKAKTYKIVVLGSSTAAGYGASSISNAWVSKYSQYLKSLDINNQVINLAVGGFTTYNILPTISKNDKDRPGPDTLHNITAALKFKPDRVIINLPSNDIAYNYSISETLSNYNRILFQASQNGVPVWITTTQPRNLSLYKRQQLKSLKDSLYFYYSDCIIDFWNPFANSDGTINQLYNSGDGIHFNDLGHSILENSVENSNILKTVISDSVNTANSSYRVNIFSNPSSAGCKFEFYSAENVNVSITIINTEGKTIHKVTNLNFEGIYSYSVGSSILHSGIYIAFIEFKSADNSEIFNKKIFIN